MTPVPANILTTQELESWLGGKRDFILIDILTPESFEDEHLPGARNACVYQIDFLDRVREIVDDHARPIVVYGSSPRNLASAVAAEKLAAAGYKNLFDLKEGIEGWRAAGRSIEGAGKSAIDADDPPPANQTWRIDPARSIVEWTGRNLASKHSGTIRISGGEVRAEQNRFKSGEVLVDMNSITDTDLPDPALRKMLEAHLKSEDFFDTATHPSAKFTLREIIPISGSTPGMPNYSVRGALTMKAIEQPVEFTAGIGKLADREIVAQADFDIDRTKWNVLYGSGKFFERLGKHLVNDLISIQLRIVAILER